MAKKKNFKVGDIIKTKQSSRVVRLAFVHHYTRMALDSVAGEFWDELGKEYPEIKKKVFGVMYDDEKSQIVVTELVKEN